MPIRLVDQEVARVDEVEVGLGLPGEVGGSEVRKDEGRDASHAMTVETLASRQRRRSLSCRE